MAVINRMAELHDEITAWRHEFHSNPELGFAVHQTAANITEKLKSFGCDEVVTGIGRTGVVGVVKGNKNPEKFVVAMRADMDALPIDENTGKPYASQNPGKMHACGHDGHSAMLLGAARYLADTRNFEGTAIFIFQPAEEGEGGGKAMVEDGMMDRFGIDEVYGMHNLPGLGVGEFAIRSGAITASTDEFILTIRGRGAHAAMPHLGIDPIVVGAQLVLAFQTIVSRNVNPRDSLVISVTKFNAGFALNIIPQEISVAGTVRALNADTRAFAERRIREICAGLASASGATINIRYINNYPVTFNHREQSQKAADIAKSIVGNAQVNTEFEPAMFAEDFSYMLEARPGAFIFIGNGDSAGLHHPSYDFNDDIIPIGCSYWASLAERLMPVDK